VAVSSIHSEAFSRASPLPACSTGRSRECFRAYVEQIVLASLKPGEIVIMAMCDPRLVQEESFAKSASPGRW
jgi:hypothetical protein